MINDDLLLMKYKAAGKSDAYIAGRMGIAVEDVQRRFNLLVERGDRMLSSGYGSMQEQFTILCAQYQLLGESLKAIGMGLSNAMPPEELRQLLVPGDVDKSIRNILGGAIVLRPYVLVDPAKQIEEELKKQQRAQ